MSRRPAVEEDEGEEPVIAAKVSHVDMPEDMLAKCVEYARTALKVWFVCVGEGACSGGAVGACVVISARHLPCVCPGAQH